MICGERTARGSPLQVQQLPDRFVLDGVNALGKGQRLLIPNAYHELEAYFAAIGIL